MVCEAKGTTAGQDLTAQVANKAIAGTDGWRWMMASQPEIFAWPGSW